MVIYYQLIYYQLIYYQLICYQLICYQLICYQHTCNQNQLLSATCAIQTYAIKLIYFPLNCDHIHLLSSLTCYQVNLLSILSCNQQFCYQLSFAIKFFPKNPPKMEKFLKILKSSFSGKLCVGMELARVVASSKGICQPFER